MMSLPPIGAWTSSVTVEEFTLTMPCRIFGANSNAWQVSSARIDEVNPYWMRLVTSTACSTVSAASTRSPASQHFCRLHLTDEIDAPHEIGREELISDCAGRAGCVGHHVDHADCRVDRF
jgi:hypothetical protein